MFNRRLTYCVTLAAILGGCVSGPKERPQITHGGLTPTEWTRTPVLAQKDFTGQTLALISHAKAISSKFSDSPDWHSRLRAEFDVAAKGDLGRLTHDAQIAGWCSAYHDPKWLRPAVMDVYVREGKAVFVVTHRSTDRDDLLHRIRRKVAADTFQMVPAAPTNLPLAALLDTSPKQGYAQLYSKALRNTTSAEAPQEFDRMLTWLKLVPVPDGTLVLYTKEVCIDQDRCSSTWKDDLIYGMPLGYCRFEWKP